VSCSAQPCPRCQDGLTPLKQWANINPSSFNLFLWGICPSDEMLTNTVIKILSTIRTLGHSGKIHTEKWRQLYQILSGKLKREQTAPQFIRPLLSWYQNQLGKLTKIKEKTYLICLEDWCKNS
jgi:hypothetical protein